MPRGIHSTIRCKMLSSAQYFSIRRVLQLKLQNNYNLVNGKNSIYRQLKGSAYKTKFWLVIISKFQLTNCTVLRCFIIIIIIIIIRVNRIETCFLQPYGPWEFQPQPSPLQCAKANSAGTKTKRTLIMLMLSAIQFFQRIINTQYKHS